eukprot:scaffold168156_cov31-Attheya_sp.AAC.1
MTWRCSLGSRYYATSRQHGCIFLQGTWNPPTAIAWLASELATWPPDDRAEVMHILNWLRLACMKRGRSVAATAAQTSTLAMDWTVILADREYIRWSKKYLDGLLGVAQDVQTSPAPQTGDSRGLFTTPLGNNANPLNAREMQD